MTARKWLSLCRRISYFEPGERFLSYRPSVPPRLTLQRYVSSDFIPNKQENVIISEILMSSGLLVIIAMHVELVSERKKMFYCCFIWHHKSHIVNSVCSTASDFETLIIFNFVVVIFHFSIIWNLELGK